MEDVFELASINAKSLEEILLTPESVSNLSEYEADDVICRCKQIIMCMEIILKESNHESL